MPITRALAQILHGSSLVLALLGISWAPATNAATFNVSTLIDDAAAVDANPGDGVCADSFNACTLRAAIMEANSLVGMDEIRFISAGSWTAASGMPALPTITERLTINAFSAPGHNDGSGGIANNPPVVTLDGRNLSGSADGLRFFGAAASNSVISALAIINFPDNGVEVGVDADNLIIDACFIGLDPAGNLGANRNGVSIINSGEHIIGSRYNSGGQNFFGLGNVISGNTEAGITAIGGNNLWMFQNIIGATPDMSSPLGNGSVGIQVNGDFTRIGRFDLNDNEIGGNTLVANQGNALVLFGVNQSVEGNYIGVTPQGIAMGNSGDGIVHTVGFSIIGGDRTSAVNHIANNQNGIVLGFSNGAAVEEVSIINNDIGYLNQGNSGVGLMIANGSKVEVRANRVTNNLAGGIQAQGDNHILTSNQIGTRFSAGQWLSQGNGGFGISLITTSESIRVGGNSSEANIIANTNAQGGFNDAISAQGIRHQINNNWIGVSPTGVPLGNVGTGVFAEGELFQVHDNHIGFNSEGVRLIGQGHSVRRNFIGTNSSGNNQGNQADGIVAGGSDSAVLENTIAWNGGNGIDASDSSNQLIVANRIAFNNVHGIHMDTANDAQITDNRIYGQTNGIQITGASLRNTIRANHMFANNGLAIDLAADGPSTNDNGDNDTGPNRLMNSPELELANLVGAGGSGPSLNLQYRVNSSSTNADYPLRVDFYWTDREEANQGRYYLGQATYPNPFMPMSTSLPLAAGTLGGQIIAITCDNANNCSEFSNALTFGQIDLIFSDSLETF